MILRLCITILCCILLLGIVEIASVIIEPNSRENLGPLCDGSKRLWLSKIDGRNNTYMSYLQPCHLDEKNITLVVSGSYYDGIITCEYDTETCLYIKNINTYPIDIRYEIDEIIQQNIYIPLFIASIISNVLVIVLAIILFVIGIYTGKKSKGITYVIPGDQILFNYMLLKTDNIEPITPFINS